MPTATLGYSVLKQASPDRIKEMLRILNWLAAPVGSQEYLLMNYGVKDTHWTPDDRGNLRDLERFISRGIPRKVAEGFDANAYKAVAPPLTSWRPSRPPARTAAPRPPRPNTYASSRPASPSRPSGGNGRTAMNSRPQFSDRGRRRP